MIIFMASQSAAHRKNKSMCVGAVVERRGEVYDSTGILSRFFSTELPVHLLGAKCNNTAKRKSVTERLFESMPLSTQLCCYLIVNTLYCLKDVSQSTL